jgi:RHS repeat-associated protein
MTPYSHNTLNQITALGGSSGARAVSVRGSTSEAAKVKAKTGAAGSSWKNARMLDGNRFETDLDLATGANEIDLQARDGSGNISNYTGHVTQPSPETQQTELVMTLLWAYDLESGSWLSAEPIKERGGMNLYGYVGGASWFSDPSGLWRET